MAKQNINNWLDSYEDGKDIYKAQLISEGLKLNDKIKDPYGLYPSSEYVYQENGKVIGAADKVFNDYVEYNKAKEFYDNFSKATSPDTPKHHYLIRRPIFEVPKKYHPGGLQFGRGEDPRKQAVGVMSYEEDPRKKALGVMSEEPRVKKNGGWLDSYHDGGEVGHKHPWEQPLPTSASIGSENRSPNIVIPQNLAKTPEEIKAVQQAIYDRNLRAITPGTAEWYEKSSGRADYVPIEMAILPGTPAIKGLGKLGNLAVDAINPLSGIGKTTGAKAAEKLTVSSADNVGKVITKRPTYLEELETNIKPELIPYQKTKSIPKTKEEIILDSYRTTPSPDRVLVKQGIDGNFITRPLTPFTKNELESGQQWYRKIGDEKGLKDLIDKGGAQAPKPLHMKSGQTVDVPFFGKGDTPTESYSGMYAVEVKPEAANKYLWTNYVGGVKNYGSVPYTPAEGTLKNMPLEDLNVYRKKWFSNNYKKLDPNNLEEGLKYAGLQKGVEKAWKWGVRGAIAEHFLGNQTIARTLFEPPNDSKKKNGGWLDNL